MIIKIAGLYGIGLNYLINTLESDENFYPKKSDTEIHQYPFVSIKNITHQPFSEKFSTGSFDVEFEVKEGTEFVYSESTEKNEKVSIPLEKLTRVLLALELFSI